MSTDESKQAQSFSLEENLKKALTEMLILYLLAQKDCYIGELTETLSEKSGGALSIVFPYGAIYRLEQEEYIVDCGKRNAPDGRRRHYYRITEAGRTYLQQLLKIYKRFFDGVSSVLERGE